MLENTTAGYALYGEKPVYLGSFCQPEWLMPGSSEHEEATNTLLALKILKTIIPNQKTADYMLVFNDSNDVSPQSNEFMIINRKAFIRVVEENLLLFKSKFGHDVTPARLIENLISPNKGFSYLFGKEIALQGIVLGYGTDNSITYERGSSLIEIVTSRSPLSPPNKLPPPPATEAEMILTIENNPGTQQNWKKIKEETNDFSYYKSLGTEDKLKIPFSFKQNSEETKALLNAYRKAQNRVSKILEKNNFLIHILKKFKTDSELFLLQKSSLLNPFSEREKKELPLILARSIHLTFSEELSRAFIDGWNGVESEKNVNSSENFQELEFLEILRRQTLSLNERLKKIKESQQFLQECAKKEQVQPLIPNKLYISTLKPGDSTKPLGINHKSITAVFLIKDILGNPLIGSYKLDSPSQLNREEMIPGFSHGVIGMNVGEVRDIYIHPDFAYGTYSKFGDGMALQIRVELIAIEDNSNLSRFPLLQPVDVAHFTPEITNCSDYQTYQDKYDHLCGLKNWNHYKKAEHLANIPAMTPQLSSKNLEPLTTQEKDLLLKLNWLIYNNQEAFE